MRTHVSLQVFALITVAAIIAVAAQVCPAQPSVAPSGGANIAAVAAPSTSYVSGDTALTNLNSGASPRRSFDAPPRAYGNWPRVGTQWVQYDWPQAISTARVEVYWWADGQGINLPGAYRVLYWDGSAFVPVAHPSGLGLARNQFNVTTFDEVKTSKLRLEIDSTGGFSTGILQWRVIDSGKSPKFPPVAMAGPDRTVVVGGVTYLSGSGKTLGESANSYAWSKAAGPGNVIFADANKGVTTAKFSAPGDYRLKFTVTDSGLSASSTVRVKVERPPPAHRLEPVDPRPWKLNSVFWQPRMKAVIVNWIPHCVNELEKPELPEGGFDNFVRASERLAGKENRGHIGPPWADAYVHNTVESICLALMLDPGNDPETAAAQKALRAKLDEWIPKILAAQEPDGYLQTTFTGRPNARWRDRGAHEGYTGGYFIEAAIAHYLMTGRKDARMYSAAKKLADCWCANIGPAPKRAWFDGHEEMEQALVRLGRLVNADEGKGKGQKYIELAKFLLDSRRNGSEYDQSHLPVVQQYTAEGHSVRAAYCYSAMADIAMETGDKDYQSAVMSIWDNLVNRKYYVTGGIGSGESSEGFGPDYSLRNNAYCESCANVGELLFQYKMQMDYHDASYVDLYEETLYNAILGDLDLDGKNFYYQNPLNGGGTRYAWHNCPCCVGNIARALLMLPTWMYTRDTDGIYVNLFAGSSVTLDGVSGGTVSLEQTTDYPWSGKIAVTVNPASAKRFALHIRVPNRTTSELYSASPTESGIKELKVDGAPVKLDLKNGYAVITRTWKAGDKVTFELPMAVQRVKASDKVAADAGRVALRVGPLIYNFEANDQDINQVLNPSAPLTTEFRPDLLGGVLVVKGAFANGSPLTAIPNYARNNRIAPGERRGGGSVVWIKDR